LFLENIRTFLEESNKSELNAIQALIIYHIGKNMVKVNEIVKNHFYEGSNPSYNLKKMLAAHYLKTYPSSKDRRVLFITLSEKGKKLHEAMEQFFQSQERVLDQSGFSWDRWKAWFDEGQTLLQISRQAHEVDPAPSFDADIPREFSGRSGANGAAYFAGLR
jgi:DNA-binding MarR family transcriptional regulator